MADAPVCHVSPNQTITQPDGPKLPSIPRATDLASALQAINAIRQMLMVLTGQMAQRPPPGPIFVNVGPNGSGGSAAGAGLSSGRSSNSSPQSNARWTEVSRSTVNRRISNPEDPEQFVDVKQINKLTMRDSVTGELWVFNGGS